MRELWSPSQGAGTLGGPLVAGLLGILLVIVYLDIFGYISFLLFNLINTFNLMTFFLLGISFVWICGTRTRIFSRKYVSKSNLAIFIFLNWRRNLFSSIAHRLERQAKQS